MKIRCVQCGEYFFADDEIIEIMSQGNSNTEPVNTCDECFKILKHQYHFNKRMIIDSDPIGRSKKAK